MGRRIRNLRVNNVLLAALFRQGQGPPVVMHGMPEDARITAARCDTTGTKDETVFTIESETFEVVEPGQAVPVFVIEVERG